MLQWRCHVPKSEPHAGCGHMNGCDLEIESSGRFVVGRWPIGRHRIRSTLLRQARKIIQYRRDEIAVTGILGWQSLSIQSEKLARLVSRLRPRGGRRRQQLFLETGLTLAQVPRMAFDLGNGT